MYGDANLKLRLIHYNISFHDQNSIEKLNLIYIDRINTFDKNSRQNTSKNCHFKASSKIMKFNHENYCLAVHKKEKQTSS